MTNLGSFYAEIPGAEQSQNELSCFLLDKEQDSATESTNVTEGISAEQSREYLSNLSKADRAALLRFLESL